MNSLWKSSHSGRHDNQYYAFLAHSSSATRTTKPCGESFSFFVFNLTHESVFNKLAWSEEQRKGRRLEDEEKCRCQLQSSRDSFFPRSSKKPPNNFFTFSSSPGRCHVMIMKSLQSLKPLTNFCPIFGIAAKLFQLNFNDDKVPPKFSLDKEIITSQNWSRPRPRNKRINLDHLSCRRRKDDKKCNKKFCWTLKTGKEKF